MIQITADQIERVNLILSGVPKGAEKAMASVIRRANNTVRSEALKGITSVYAITRQNVRADTTINATLIVKGKKTLEQVPARLKAEVEDLLTALEITL